MKALSSTEILDVPLTEPERIFPDGTAAAVDLALASLRRCWHPDRNPAPEASDVFAHLGCLAQAAKGRYLAGDWRGPANLDFRCEDGRARCFQAQRIMPLEIGHQYIGRQEILYVYRPDQVRYREAFLRAVNDDLRFPDPAFAAEFQRYFPRVLRLGTSGTGGAVIGIEKPEDAINLQDLLDRRGPLAPEHVGWIVAALFSIAAFLERIGLHHGAITAKHCFLSPQGHVVYLLGGWCHARREGEAFLALPRQIVEILPRRLLEGRPQATGPIDRYAIRALGLEALGDATRSGTPLLAHPERCPPALLGALLAPPPREAVDDVRLWYEALQEAFGRRRYVALDVDFAALYPPITLINETA
jgi:hypothetical protein